MKIKKYSELQGEWWIVDGQPLYADGSIGDKDHESYVIDHVQALYADDEFNKGDYVDWSLFERKVLNEKLQELGVSESSDDDKLLLEGLIEKGMTPEEIQIARGYGDAREYGISHLGWKRVKRDYIETQTLSAKDLAQIANGLWTAYEGYDEEELSFTIEVRSNNTMYDDVPLSIIEKNTPTDLLPYRRARYAKRYNWYRKAVRMREFSVSKALEILNLQPGATESDIKSARNNLAKKYHSDKSDGNHQKMAEVNVAFEFLEARGFDTSVVSRPSFEFSRPSHPTWEERDEQEDHSYRPSDRYYLSTFLDGKEQLGSDYSRIIESLDENVIDEAVETQIDILKKLKGIKPYISTSKEILLKIMDQKNKVLRTFNVTKIVNP